MTRPYTYYNITRALLTLLMLGCSVSAWAQDPDPTYVAQIESTPYESLQAAIEAATNGQTVTLMDNISETANYTIDGKHITINFGTYTVTANHNNGSAKVFSITSTGGLTLQGTTGGFTDNTVKGIFYNEGTLTVEGGNYSTTEDDYGVIFNEGGTCNVSGGTLTGAYSAIYTKGTNTVNVSTGTINGAYIGIQANAGTTLNVTGGTITATNQARKYPGLYLIGEGTTVTVSGGTISGWDGISVREKASLTVNAGATISAKNAAIIGNGNEGQGNTTITINGGTMTSKDTGIYHPQIGTLTINGGSITGEKLGVEIRAGELSVTGGTITATADTYSCIANTNGTTTIGAALAIAQHTTKQDITVTISGGTFTGKMAISESNPQENDPAPQVTMSVTDGRFNGGITTADVTNFISGGTFSEQPAAAYCSDGFVPERDVSGHYGVLYDLQMTDATTMASLSAQNTKVVKATYTRSTGMVGAGSTTGTQYGTICLPFEITASITGMKLYKATGISASALTITEVETIDAEHKIPAGTPLIFELSAAATTLTVTSSYATVSTAVPATEPAGAGDNLLVGTYNAATITTGLENIYYLNGDKFHQAKVSLNVPAFRAYIKDTSAGARQRTLTISKEGDDVTGIQQSDALETVTAIYDLNGHKLSGLQRGLNIMRRTDGSTMKVIVK